MGTLIYLFFPSECDNSDMTIPALFYSTLFIFNLVLFLTIINEGVIFSLSMKGRINDTKNSRKFFPYVLEIRGALMLVEFITLVVTSVGTFNGSVGGEAIECEQYREGPLVFAKVIVCLAWILVIVLALSLFFAVDPLGMCSPSVLDEIEDLGDLGRELDEEGFIVPGKIGEDE